MTAWDYLHEHWIVATVLAILILCILDNGIVTWANAFGKKWGGK